MHVDGVSLLTDVDVERLLPALDAVKLMESALIAHARGELLAPPRFSLAADRGALVFTAGGLAGSEPTLGFRVYSTFPDDGGAGARQLVAVFDGESGKLDGIIVGSLLGERRTGAIGAVAVDRLARRNASRVAMIGSGAQARSQLEAIACVRNLSSVRVFSRTAEHRRAFALEMSERLAVDISTADGTDEAIADADIIVCATSSPVPVLEATSLRAGVHVTTLGPKLQRAHELSVDAVALCDRIVTDSHAQATAYAPAFFLAGTEAMERMIELAHVVDGAAAGRTREDEITLFCSVGLAGTEVVLAKELLARANGADG